MKIISIHVQCIAMDFTEVSGGGGEAYHGRVLLNVKQVNGNVALKENIVNCCLAFQAEHIGSIRLVERHAVSDGEPWDG